MPQHQPIVLMIEDDEASAESSLKTILAQVPGITATHEPDFAKAEERIQELSPDILVLDIFHGDPVADNDPAGMTVWDRLWKGKFCPIVFHTAKAPQVDPIPQDHPFVKVVQKKHRSDFEVSKLIKEYLPHVAALRGVEREISGVVQSVLKEVAAVIWKSSAAPAERDRLLMRAARRRVAAMMDEVTLGDGKAMASWEQYLIPPIGRDPMMGDILRSSEGDPADPKSYRVVLSPSCDMVKGRQRCLSQVLVAACGPISNYMVSANLKDTKDAAKLKAKLPTLLTQDQCGGHIPLPPLPGVLPLMAASLRSLELIPYENIGGSSLSGVTFVRAASVDSPFRERMAWAYLQIAARPGMPECDSEEFMDAIVEASKTPGK